MGLDMDCNVKNEIRILCQGKEGRNVIKLLDKGYKGIFVILRILHESDSEIVSADLAKRLGVSTARIATALNTLERKGYIKRTPSDSDGRKVAILLTPSGVEALETREREIDGVIASLFEKLTEEEKFIFFTLVKKLLQ